MRILSLNTWIHCNTILDLCTDGLVNANDAESHLELDENLLTFDSFV